MKLYSYSSEGLNSNADSKILMYRAKANPDLKIVLVEGGKNNFNDPTVVNPAVYLSHLAPDSKTALVGHHYALPLR